jgi:hypothetical protein
MNTLFIGEDSSGHTNNFVWAYSPETKELERIISVPAGAEATGLQAVDDRNGFSYTMSNFQHPGDNLSKLSITAVNKENLIKTIAEGPYGVDQNAAVGYLQGLSLADTIPVKFNDVNENHWAYKYISSLVKSGIIKGKSDKIFDPEEALTRGQFASMLVRALELKAQNTAPFKDVSGQLSEEAAAAYESGIIKGVTTDKFYPNQKINREQMAAMIMRAYEVKTGSKYASKTTHQYKDRASITPEFRAQIDAVHELDIMTGNKDGSFQPKAKSTRAQAAKVVYQLLQK